MLALTIIVVAFLVMELANVGALYFAPGSDKFNALGVFKAWETSKRDPELHALVRYLAYWVAGTKLIFIGLVIAVLIAGSTQLKIICVAVLMASIVSFFWRMFPLIRSMDRQDELTIPGYSRVLGIMIAGILVALGAALVAGYVVG